MYKKNFVILADEFNIKSKYPIISVFPNTVDFKRNSLNYNQIKLQHIEARKYCDKLSTVVNEFYNKTVLCDENISLKKIIYPYSYMMINTYLNVFIRVKMLLNQN